MYVFLKLGMYPKKSMDETIITDIRGLPNCHQTKIAQIASAKTIVSLLVISLVPYFKENKSGCSSPDYFNRSISKATRLLSYGCKLRKIAIYFISESDNQ